MKNRKELHKELLDYWTNASEYEKLQHFSVMLTNPSREDIIMKIVEGDAASIEDAKLYIDVLYSIIKNERCGRVLRNINT